MADIHHAIQIAAKPEAIYPLFATAGGFGKWWATDIVDEGGAVELGFFNRATIYRLRLQAEHPPSEAEWVCDTGDEWNGTHLQVRIEPAKSGSVLKERLTKPAMPGTRLHRRCSGTCASANRKAKS